MIAKPPSETEITKSIRALLKSVRVFHWKNWSGPLTPNKGIPDILGVYHGRFLAIEVKRPGCNPTADQQKFLDRINAEGGLAFVARSVDDVIVGLGISDRFLFAPSRTTTCARK